MLKTANPDQQQVPNIVKVEPMLKRLRFSRLLILIGAGLWLLGLVVVITVSVIDKTSHLPGGFFLFNGLFLFAYFIFMLFYSTWLITFWKRLEQRRQRAAAGDQKLLAAEQPIPDANALPLPAVLGQPAPVQSDYTPPVTFVQRPNWKVFLIIFGLLFLATITFAIVFLLFSPALFPPLPHHHTLSPAVVFIVVAAIVVFMLLFCGLLFGVMYYKARQHLTVTEHGLLMPGFRTVHSVSWRDAKLFAIDGIFGAKRYPYPTVFELSSASDVVRWTWMRRSSFRVLFYARPALSQEDYNRQMQSLLSFIAARTSLPLYDLRQEPNP